MHDVQVGNTACFHRDEAEERDVVHHELCQFRSNVSWTSVDETLNVRSVFFVKSPGVLGFGGFHPDTIATRLADVYT